LRRVCAPFLTAAAGSLHHHITVAFVLDLAYKVCVFMSLILQDHGALLSEHMNSASAHNFLAFNRLYLASNGQGASQEAKSSKDAFKAGGP
jgi:hypothetical protein